MTTEPHAGVLIDPIAVTLELTVLEAGLLLCFVRLGMDRYTAGLLGPGSIKESEGLLDKIPRAAFESFADKLEKMEFREKTK